MQNNSNLDALWDELTAARYTENLAWGRKERALELVRETLADQEGNEEDAVLHASAAIRAHEEAVKASCLIGHKIFLLQGK